MEKEQLTRLAIEQIEASGRSDERLIHRGRFVNVDMMLGVGEAQWLFTIGAGKILTIVPGPLVMPSITFEISAPEQEWHRFWAPTPPPGSQDLFALLKRRVLKLNGNLQPFMSNLFYFKFLLAAPREQSQ